MEKNYLQYSNLPSDLNEKAISLGDEREAVNEKKSGKAPGLDEFRVECLHKGGMVVLEWLVRLLNVSFDMLYPWTGVVHA